MVSLSTLYVWSQIVLAKKNPKGKIVGYLCVGLIIGKTKYSCNMSDTMFQHVGTVQCALILCLVSLSCIFYFCVRSLNILWRFDSRGLLHKKLVSRSKERRFILSLILENVVATFKEIIYLLLEYCGDWIYDLVCWLFSLWIKSPCCWMVI